MSNAKSAKKLFVTNTVTVVPVATSTFTSDVLFSPIQAEFHDHPLIPFCKSITFTCDICGKEGKGVPNLCGSHAVSGFIEGCASLPTQSESLDTHYGLYYCSTCDFVTHLDCAGWRNREELKDEEFTESKATLEIEDTKLGEFADSSAYKVKKTNVGKDGTEIATEIEHFSHEHDLKLSDDEVQNNEICDGCVRAILPPFYSLISDILTHPGHDHQLILSSVVSEHNCSCCGFKISPIFRCTTCDFALDFKCATLPHTTSYKQHEHPFTLRYTAEDDSGEYYCDICEEERDSKHWFYYCEDCSYPAHPKCILGKYPNCNVWRCLHI
uniref:Phorbol-ester/DAG-type domain-containing protein n=1 Tax=Fagus sylvatica TaxID=28930 RepID=A0A2N9HM99_FAGSY